MNVIKLYGTGAATANAVASVVIPSKGRIRGVQFNVVLDSITDSSRATIEISRASASEIGVVGSQQCIAECGIMSNFVTSGLSTSGANWFAPCDVPVIQGQIIYLHAFVAGTATYIATAILHYD